MHPHYLFATTSIATACSAAAAVITYGNGFSLPAGVFCGAATLGGLTAFYIAVGEVTNRIVNSARSPTFPPKPLSNSDLKS